MTRYLLLRAAAFHLLIDANLVASIGDAAMPDGVDVSRALHGGPASVFVTLGGAARVRQVGVDAVHGLIELADAQLVPLPALSAAAAEDIDAVTLSPHDGAHAFRLRLDRSSATTTT
jgi:hypothetical protein